MDRARKHHTGSRKRPEGCSARRASPRGVTGTSSAAARARADLRVRPERARRARTRKGRSHPKATKTRTRRDCPRLRDSACDTRSAASTATDTGPSSAAGSCSGPSSSSRDNMSSFGGWGVLYREDISPWYTGLISMNALEDIEDAYNVLFFFEFCLRAWAFEFKKEFWSNPVTAVDFPPPSHPCSPSSESSSEARRCSDFSVFCACCVSSASLIAILTPCSSGWCAPTPWACSSSESAPSSCASSSSPPASSTTWSIPSIPT